MIRKRFIFSGCVQGVGFRYRLKYASELNNVTGWVRNNYNGEVESEMQGNEKDIDAAILIVENGKYIRIENIRSEVIQIVENEHIFYIK